MNEGVYRSPKWLKRFFDYELSTGDDISGKREENERVRREAEEKISKEKAEKERLLRNWEERWNKLINKTPITIHYTLEAFLEKYYNKEFYDMFSGVILKHDIEKVKNRWIGDFNFLESFEKFVEDRYKKWADEARKKYEEEKKKKAEEKARQEIEVELNILYYKIGSDFRMNPFNDKYSTGTVDGETSFNYTFEDGGKLLMYGNILISGRFKYTLGMSWRNKFVTLINDVIINKGRKRPSNKSNPGNHHGHPKGNLYQTLKDTVAQRKEQLSKMSKNDPNRISMENELDNAERKLREMKNKYQFEHISSFNLFNQ